MQSFKNILGLGSSNAHQYNINDKIIRDEKLLSEGAFAFVWSARDIRSNKLYALKKILCQDRERLNLANREISFLEQIPPHPNLISYHGSVIVPYEKLKEVNLLLELCDGGHLLDLLDKNHGVLEEDQIIAYFIEIVKGVHHLHTLDTPIAHRDLKVENILLNKEGKLKICDFGSCSSSFIDTKTCSREDLLRERESIERYTTMLYRSPEMVDLHRQYRIDEKVDIWMLGCILFTMAFYRHPFQDESSLAISNAKYDFPASHRYSKNITDLIHWMLSIEPSERPSSGDLLNILENYRNMKEIPLPKVIVERVLLYDQRKSADRLVFQKPFDSVEFTNKPRKGSKRLQNKVLSTDDFFNPSVPKWSEGSHPVADNMDLFSVDLLTDSIHADIWDTDSELPRDTNGPGVSNGWASFDEEIVDNATPDEFMDLDFWESFPPSQNTKDSPFVLGGDSTNEAPFDHPFMNQPPQNDFLSLEHLVENKNEPLLESLSDLQFNPSSNLVAVPDIDPGNLKNATSALVSNNHIFSSSPNSAVATTHVNSELHSFRNEKFPVMDIFGSVLQVHDDTACTPKKAEKNELFNDLAFDAENSTYMVTGTADTSLCMSDCKETGNGYCK
ncbi:Tyrosine kinase-like (TKL) protein [Cardiosporidium cionae]|uniref:non-specific serine/threonine protein kinase n=1 Tax=Cardiosporidium cionae TaxID=476202 RepID=A0ABQ7J8A7_9APIC|nr:Tyrosine kinase-like (TKL) protein [Cardiosporidium cionae]|eukprot:KAF8820169.1 Tyrosine kinase-like (TKL) protein [Cardiosporidium cionae]